MIIHRDGSGYRNIRNAVVTVGSFDGVHAGHRIILRSLRERAAACGGESVLITFHPHPRKVLGLDTEHFRLLNTLPEKEYLLAQCGVDHLLEIEFTPEFSRMDSETFVRDFLCARMDVKHIVIGYNHHFGHNREGGFEQLQRLCGECGFGVSEIPEHDIAHEKISSTVIRNALAEGDMRTATRYLLEPYFFFAPVDEDGYLVVTDEMKLIPPPGHYRVRVEDDYSAPRLRFFAVAEVADGRVRIELPENQKFSLFSAPRISFLEKYFFKK